MFKELIIQKETKKVKNKLFEYFLFLYYFCIIYAFFDRYFFTFTPNASLTQGPMIMSYLDDGYGRNKQCC